MINVNTVKQRINECEKNKSKELNLNNLDLKKLPKLPDGQEKQKIKDLLFFLAIFFTNT